MSEEVLLSNAQQKLNINKYPAGRWIVTLPANNTPRKDRRAAWLHRHRNFNRQQVQAHGNAFPKPTGLRKLKKRVYRQKALIINRQSFLEKCLKGFKQA